VKLRNRERRNNVPKVMRIRRLAIVSGVIMLVGCGTSAVPQATGPASPAAQSAAAHSAPISPTGSPGSPTASPVSVGRGCPANTALRPPAGVLTGVEFVSAARGWVVGQDKILATTDGGRHWIVQDSGRLNLTSVDFIGNGAGWAVGADSLLATSDGGAHWTTLPEPCPLIRSVHFVSATVGFAVAGGRDISQFGSTTPELGGEVLVSTDGGHSWRVLPAPKDAQSVCFDNAEIGWLGAGGQLFRSTDGGRTWAHAAGVRSISAGYAATMTVQCAGAGSAWAMDIGPGAAMNQQPHIGYHAGAGGAVPIFAEQYFPHPGVSVRANSPGSYAGAVSAISPTAAAFVDWCPACGLGSAPWALVTSSGARLTREGNVGRLTQPEAASFLSPQLGWVVGLVMHYRGASSFRQYQRIVRTDDGGRTWLVQYTSP
jgi:Photosynthesis system II assembly factor YCF48